MTRMVALLRGINVGGNKKVPMATLREVLDGLGHRDVATLLQSGNAVFTARNGDAAKLERGLERALQKTFGFEVPVVVRTRDALAQAMVDNPLRRQAEADPTKFLVTFFGAPPDAAKAKALAATARGEDQLVFTERHAYAHFPKGIGTSKLAEALSNTRWGTTATARNWNTLKKLLALADGGAP